MRATLKRHLQLISIVSIGTMAHGAQSQESAATKMLVAELSIMAAKEKKVAVLEGRLQLLFDLSDLDADGVVTVADAVAANQLRSVAFRKSAHETWAQHNLNGDMKVTAAEIAQTVRQQAVNNAVKATGNIPPDPSAVDEALALLMAKKYKKLIDPNGDGDVSYQELLDVTLAEYPSDLEPLANRKRPFAKLAVRPVFDTDGNGIVNRTEYESQVEAALKLVNPNNNRRVSKSELDGVKSVADQGRLLAKRAPTWLAVAMGESAEPQPMPSGPAPPLNMKFLVRMGSDRDDVLGGTTGPDVFRGAKGNDRLIGHEGEDNYFFAPGDGHDIIEDVGSSGNIVRFISGVAATELTRSQESGADGSSDLVIGYGQNDTIRIVGWFDWPKDIRDAWKFEYLSP